MSDRYDEISVGFIDTTSLAGDFALANRLATILREKFPEGDGDIAKLKAMIVLLRQAEGRSVL